jgi:putative hydrolase of the HAD superfamily
LYADALQFAAARSDDGLVLTPEQIADASAILERYNTRLHPRTHEVASATIFGQARVACGLPGGEARRDTFTEHFFGFFQQQAAVYEDVLPVLHELRRAGLSVGVLTDVPYGMDRALVRRDLEAIPELDAVLDALLTSVDVGRRKPEPNGFLALARTFDAEPREMAFVGNERKDVEGANQAGMFSVLLDRENLAPDWGQQARVRSLDELPDVLVRRG